MNYWIDYLVNLDWPNIRLYATIWGSILFGGIALDLVIGFVCKRYKEWRHHA